MPAKSTGLGPFSRFLLSALVGCLATLLIGCGLWFVDDIILDVTDHQQIPRPADSAVSYAVNSVGIVEQKSGLFKRHLNYQVYVGCEAGMGYGHGFVFDNGDDPPVISAVGWEPGGVRVRLYSGHELFFPIEQQNQYCWR